MAQRNLNTGTVANDGTGDSIRIAGIKMNDNFTELYATTAVLSQIGLAQNEITSNSSDADIVLKASGTGSVSMSNLTIDSNINITDNIIKTTSSNSDLVLEGNGTGTVTIASIDVDNGNVDGTVIGATTPAAASFTTMTSPVFTSDNLTISDNNITTTSSNADLNFTANGTGNVKISGFELPNSDGNFGQVLQTDGSATLSFFSAPVLFEHTNISDATVTLSGASSSPQVVDSFSSTTFRSAKYHLQISDTTANRFTLQDLNVVHGPGVDSTVGAYISNFGGVTNVAGYFPIDFTVDINNGNVRLLGTVNNTNNQVIKLVRREINA